MNDLAEPLGKITNVCVIEANEIWPKTAIETTDVNCWNPGIIYVDIYDVAGDNTGMSWDNAYTDLRDALERAHNCGCNQIQVAEGKYKPTKGSNRSISFDLVDGVAIYGGFPPGGGAWNERNPYVYETILSGDIGTLDYQNDNSYHVVKFENVYNAILDGFTITAGNADALGYADFNSCGGGIYGNYSLSSTITNCTFSYNSAFYGGALYDSNFSDVSITNCIFAGNTAKYYGGGIYNYQSSPALTNCAFSENHAVGYATYWGNGGGIANYQSSPTLINCTFIGKSALVSSGNHGDGGAIYNTYGSSPTIKYCILSSNLADANGGGLYNESSDPNIANCIFSGNKANLDGGGVYNTSSRPNITNCIFIGNSTDSYGGGIASYINTSLALTNCTFSGNWAHYGGGIFSLYYVDTNLTNCIFWNNVAGTDYNEIYHDGTSTLSVTYCDVKGGWTGDGNIDEDPCFFSVEQPTGSWTENASYDSLTFQSTLYDSGANWSVNGLAGKFVNPDVDLYDCLQFFIVSNDVNTIKVWGNVKSIALTGKTYQIYDYHLKLDSACLDAGDPDFNPDPNAKDIDGEPRIFDGDANGTEIVDMGADEYYWSPADFNSDGVVNFFDYALFANFWQITSLDVNDYNDVYDLVDNNCIDSNDLARFCEDWLWQTAWAKPFPCDYGKTMGLGMGRSMSESLALTEDLFPYEPEKQAQPQLTEADFEEILKWLEELWLTDEEGRKIISEDEWLKFIEAVIQAIKQEM